MYNTLYLHLGIKDNSCKTLVDINQFRSHHSENGDAQKQIEFYYLFHMYNTPYSNKIEMLVKTEF